MFADWTDRIAKGETPASQAAAPDRRRAQSRHHAVGLGGSARVFPRRHRERQAQPAHQPVRPGLRSARELVGPHDDPRAGRRHSWRQVTIPRNPAAPSDGRRGGHGGALAVLGRGNHLEHGRQRPQQRDGSEGPDVEHDLARARRAELPALLQGRLGPSVGEARRRLAARWPGRRRPAVHGLGSDSQQVRHRRHLLQRRSTSISTTTRTTRSGAAAAGSWARSTRSAGRDKGRGQVAGLDGSRSSTRTATASATRTSSRTSRSIPPRTSAFRPAATA